MDKIVDITKNLTKATQEIKASEKIVPCKTTQKVTNPILKKLVAFKNSCMSKKFDINDLI